MTAPGVPQPDDSGYRAEGRKADAGGRGPRPVNQPIMMGMPDIEHMPMLRLLSLAARATEQAWNEALRPFGLSPADATALKMLAFTGPGTQSALAESSGVRAQSLGRTLVKLEALGCISQLRQGRVKIVSLSDQGAQMLERIDEAERQVLARLWVGDRFRTELRGLVCAALT